MFVTLIKKLILCLVVVVVGSMPPRTTIFLPKNGY